MLTAARFSQRVVIALALAALALAIWATGRILLLVFGAVVLAVVIRAGGERLAALLPLSPRWGSVVVLLLILLALVTMGWLIGDEIVTQVTQFREQLPAALGRAREWLDGNALGRAVVENASGAVEEFFSAGQALTAAMGTFTAISHTALVLLLAVYLSFSPELYSRGIVALVPPRHKRDAADALTASGGALRLWLLGQMISMVVVGLLTALGLSLLGIPMAFALGLLAGLFEFIPIVGPFIAAVPGVLIAFAQGPEEALYAALIYFAVQQLESAVITPLAQRWAVKLPPALGLVAIVVFGILFGVPGLLFATPLTIVIIVLVKRFYVDRQRDRRTDAGDREPAGVG